MLNESGIMGAWEVSRRDSERGMQKLLPEVGAWGTEGWAACGRVRQAPDREGLEGLPGGVNYTALKGEVRDCCWPSSTAHDVEPRAPLKASQGIFELRIHPQMTSSGVDFSLWL